MIVTDENWAEVTESILTSTRVSIDTETTGLFPFLGDRLFSIIIANAEHEYYFNFQTYDDLESKYILRRSLIACLWGCLRGKTIFMANAKFDMHMLNFEGLDVSSCNVIDILVKARLIYNDHPKYDLASVAERAGYEKDDAVEEYIKDHKLWEWEKLPNKTKRSKKKFYDQVPFNVIHPYGERDARITYDIGTNQELDTTHIVARYGGLPIDEVEVGVTRACYHMEKRGICIDTELVRVQADHWSKIYDDLEETFHFETGIKFVDSPKGIGKAFIAAGIDTRRMTSFDEPALKALKNPLANMVLELRNSYKLANTYYHSFLHYGGIEGVVHGNFRQGGTKTGRFAFSDPNLQNVPKGDVRKSFVPREGYCFVMIDYNQMEFRMMLDYASEMGLINEINNGLDPHTATGNVAEIARDKAKTLNFALLYGVGIKALSVMLGCSVSEGKAFKNKYFSKLEFISLFMRQVKKKAEVMKKIYSWAGRIFQVPDPRFLYKAPNALIQGGCADVVKQAMVGLDTFLQLNWRSRMLLQVHDEILFEVHKDELNIINDLVHIMENIYPHKHIKLTCSVEHSWKSWGEPVEGLPNVE